MYVESLVSLQVQGYACDIVVLLCDFGIHGHYLCAVNISDAFGPRQQPSDYNCHPRVLLCTRLWSTNKLFVRHNRRFLVLGTHSALGNHDHHEWLLHRYDLETARPVAKEPLQLRNFCGSEMGSTVCFTIYQDNFYALTNQTSYESEEVDWTSYYHFIHFPLDDPLPDLKVRAIWRRQHLEGPINDSWTDLGFQIDHGSGELLIVECRKEWLAGGSRSVRTYYTQPFERALHGDLHNGHRHPPGDPLGRTLDAKNNSRWEESRPRLDRFVHTEIQESDDRGVKEYIRAKTKWNGYHFNAQAFVDLVTDEVSVEGEWRPKERIKLRVASRHELSPLVSEDDHMNGSSFLLRPPSLDKEGEVMPDGEEAFSPTKVSLWPPDDAPPELHDMLCPGGRGGEVKAILGDQGMVYTAGPAREPGSRERALIFVSFDPTFGFEGMKRLDGSLAIPKQRDLQSDAVRKRKNVGERGEPADACPGNEDTSPTRGSYSKRVRKSRDRYTPSQSEYMGEQAGSHNIARRDYDNDKKAEYLDGTAGQAAASDEPFRPTDVSGKQADRLGKQTESFGEHTSKPNYQTNVPHAPRQDPLIQVHATASPTTYPLRSNESSLPSSKPLETWRERAAYTTIRQGFWLR
ncbi:hypothetical protein A1O1_06843 [Capronia coronata CBS 617.96]|uniref:F-box domain-containing protein n=1 Tax=Capronia coronata CBS 617.96 TaxID=1182541 RepID=W9YLS5_9EURO|nr:uncharacterized protein A1O1_06843 [Capronia coronata CBS 617.96]EXJ83224.1 hypothetical protein A1O1_06843 [Capronia coronata CBS 617.96]